MGNKVKSSGYILYMLIALLCACKKEDAGPSNGDNTNIGTGGSMARFVIKGNYLYTIDETDLNVFDISQPTIINFINRVSLGINIETIFPYKNNLFIGSSGGMLIYNIDRPDNPAFLSSYAHIVSCDPVVADDKYAYVTLRTGESRCSRGMNQLDIVDIQNLSNPKLVKSVPLINPKGIGLDGTSLFICDNLLKVYDVSVPTDIKLKRSYSANGFDVIPQNGLLMLIGPNGLYQYEYKEDTLVYKSLIRVVPSVKD